MAGDDDTSDTELIAPGHSWPVLALATLAFTIGALSATVAGRLGWFAAGLLGAAALHEGTHATVSRVVEGEWPAVTLVGAGIGVHGRSGRPLQRRQALAVLLSPQWLVIPGAFFLLGGQELMWLAIGGLIPHLLGSRGDLTMARQIACTARTTRFVDRIDGWEPVSA